MLAPFLLVELQVSRSIVQVHHQWTNGKSGGGQAVVEFPNWNSGCCGLHCVVSAFDPVCYRFCIARLSVPELIEKCIVCSALIDEEDLFCANCGTEAPPKQTESAETKVTHSFVCSGCGASMVYDAEDQNLSCPFCGSERLEKESARKELKAQYVVAFSVKQAQAEKVLQNWLGTSRFFRPSDLAKSATLTNIKPVYVPYWIFSAKTITYWTADSSDVPWSASGDWRPVGGDHRDEYFGILIGASSTLTPSETQSLRPFDLSTAVSFHKVDFRNSIVEQFRVQRKYARPLARSTIEQFESAKCAKYVPGRVRNLKTNVRLEALSGFPILLPIWILAYQYKGKLFRFLVNGQTASIHGEAPFSYSKLAFVGCTILFVLLVIMAIIGFVGMAGTALSGSL